MKETKYHHFFRNFSNPLKIDIMILLKDKKMSVSEISEELNVEQSKISHALASLKCCSILKVNNDGRKRIYSLNRKTILPLFRAIENHVKVNCKGVCSCI